MRPLEKETEESKTALEPDWYTKPFLVKITIYRPKTRTPQKEQYLLLDFPKRREAEKKDQPWVWSVKDKQREGISIEDLKGPIADHRKIVALASELLTQGVPVSEILKGGAKKLGLETIRDLPSAEEAAEVREGRYGVYEEEPIKEAVKALTRVLKGKPVLADLVGKQVLSDLEKQLDEGNVGVDETLDLPRARLLTDPRVWKNKEVAVGATNLLVEALRRSGFEGKDLETSPVTEFLRERLSEDEFVETFANLDLLRRLPSEFNEIIERFLTQNGNQDLVYLVVQQVAKRLEGKKGEEVTRSAEWTLLRRALGENIFYMLPPGFLDKLSATELIETTLHDPLEERVGLLEKKEQDKKTRIATCVGIAIASLGVKSVGNLISEFIPELVEFSRGATTIATGEFLCFSVYGIYLELTRRQIEKSLDRAREQVVQLKEVLIFSKQSAPEALNHDQT